MDIDEFLIEIWSLPLVRLHKTLRDYRVKVLVRMAVLLEDNKFLRVKKATTKTEKK